MYNKVLKKCFKFYKITVVLNSFKDFCNLYKYFMILYIFYPLSCTFSAHLKLVSLLSLK